MTKKEIELKSKLRYYYIRCKKLEKEIIKLKYKLNWAEYPD